jgi:chemotaxis protein histidine kinase CheA
MNNLQKDFLKHSVANLENLIERAKAAETLPPEFLREAFRALHTIKGTSQTFGFSAPARLAHELENLLAVENHPADFKDLLLEGFGVLAESFGQTVDSAAQKSFLERLRETVPASSNAQNFSQIPGEIAGKLSEHERNRFAAAQGDGMNVYLVKAAFDFANFAAGFKKLKEDLSETGEIIATLPDSQLADKSKIGFLIYFASRESPENFAAEVISRARSFSDDAGGILARAAAHGEDLARRSGKAVEFTVSVDETKLSDEQTNLLFDAALHLVRNAVDHAIESVEDRTGKGKQRFGTIEISLETAENDLHLTVKDDGKGIDSEIIRRKAVEKNIISAGEILTEAELLALIFTHEFSTAEAVSEVSGRGVGLGAVKDSVEKAGGAIVVESRKDAGTTFSITIPKNYGL